MKISWLLFSVLFSLSGFSQAQPIKFGKISSADFQITAYDIDTSASAVVIADIGFTQIKGKKDWFSLEFKRHKRIHILKQTGFDQATVEIQLYTDGDQEEKLDDIKALAYNYENGKVTETKLDTKNAIYKEKLDKNFVIKKFTFPNVKVGSIIEFEYKIVSDFLFNLQSWYFQSDIPCIWSEYTVGLPQFLNYQLISQGYHPLALNERKDKFGTYSIEYKHKDHRGQVFKRENINISCGLSEFRWAMKDIPALKEEVFITTLKNYVAKLEFQLAGYLAPLEVEKVLPTWEDLTEKLLKREEFGKQLENTSSWLSDKMKPILLNASTESQIARNIFTHIRDNYTCTDRTQLYTENPLKKILEKKSGSVAEINLLLIAMLRFANIKADPVILSRRQHGLVYKNYPLIKRFNYVIARAAIDGKDIFLDATRPRLGFAKLDEDCYNGQIRVVDAAATPINLLVDQLLEKKVTSVNISVDNSGQWKGKVDQTFGQFESTEMREELVKIGQDAYLKKIKKGYDSDVKIKNLVLDSLHQYEDPLKMRYDFQYEGEPANIIYLNPVLVGRQNQNPFKSAKRFYPVEMPYKINEEYAVVIEIPDGYIVDEMPLSAEIKMYENEKVFFKYTSIKTGNNIKIKYILNINKTVFQPAEYNALRDFFTAIVSKQEEQIVFKKKTN